ncbi:MAG: potassium channel family protein [Phenylobacterium sp.]|uniref:potassium channel family protein n=1 Tax=Phenylobacterium sp. TaxID=1871053 RepID=UPI003BB6B8A3
MTTRHTDAPGSQALGSVRRRLYTALDPRARSTGLSPLNLVLAILILSATGLAIAETEPTLLPNYGRAFARAELVFGVLFALEYAVRLWTAPERNPGGAAWRERLRFLITPAALIDLVAVLASLAVAGGSSALLLRLVRLGRILRLAKLGRMSRAMGHLLEALNSRRDELLLSLFAGLLLMLVSATALYLAEGAIQPDKFGSIPRALWWSVATMTTIGYGDVYPITPLGKLLASIAAISSIGLIAMPTGILAAAFSDAVQRHRVALGAQPQRSTPPPETR